MKTRNIFLVMVLSASTVFAQEQKTVRFNSIEEVTSLQPTNGLVHSFMSQKEADLNQGRLILYYKQLIVDRWEEQDMVKLWREQLWRLENAKVLTR